MRARLLRANGTAANQVIIETGFDPASTAAASAYQLDAMDRWLTRIEGAGATTARAVAAAKPADLADGCYVDADHRIKQTLTYPATGRCGQLFPIAADTRLASGQDLDLTVLACHLTPFEPRAYPVTFSTQQLQRLRLTFAHGVCDQGRDGVAEQAPIAPWLGYGDDSTGLTPPTPID